MHGETRAMNDTKSNMDVNLLERFQSLGLSEQKAKETLKNGHLSETLRDIIEESDKHVTNSVDRNGKLLYQMATAIKSQIKSHLPLLVKYVSTGKLDSELKLKSAIEYLMSNPQVDVDMEQFERCSGVGIIVTAEQIKAIIEEVLARHKVELVSKRYRYNIGQILHECKSILKFADGKVLKNEVDAQVMALLGPKTEADLVKVKEDSKADKKRPPTNNSSSDYCGAATISELMKNKINFHRPGENYKSDGYVLTEKTMALMKQHLQVTGGQVRTRFPPEPNGILHIGHAKAININFGYAVAYGGVCFLRYDDTNPEKEEEKFVVGIRDAVEWLGYKPFKVTYSSDYFNELYNYAVELIRRGHAYVCHQRQDEIKGFNPPPSPWRDRPIDESLKLFEDMKQGRISEGEATMRMKITLEEGKQDPVAYRIKFIAHHRTGNKWCIYPTYDFTHCLCDSLENITHSLCTKEFQNRRSSYYWLCNVLDIYCPVQWEYGRLNVNYTVVSKRKIGKLITEKVVSDWDDPRLFTLTALRRRGFPSEAINNFCAQMGVTGAQAVVDPTMLEAFVRDSLNVSAARTMAVLKPLKVCITNFCYSESQKLTVPDFPSRDDKSSSHKIVFDRIIFIEMEDFREETSDKGYKRLTCDQPVGLRHSNFIVSVSKVIKHSDGTIKELEAVIQAAEESKAKPKGFIHWVSNPIQCEVRLYERLFKHKNPENPDEVPGGFLSDCCPDSLTVIKNALVDESMTNCKVYDTFQFERLGFFSVDPDSSTKGLVFNRTVTLKEAVGKN